MAGDFQPTGHDDAYPPERTALVRTAHVDDMPNEIELLETKVLTIRNAIVSELCQLRHDIDTLKRGGWQITVGPFQQVNEPSLSGAHGIYERVLGATDHASMDEGPVPMLTNEAHTHEVDNEDDVENGHKKLQNALADSVHLPEVHTDQPSPTAPHKRMHAPTEVVQDTRMSPRPAKSPATVDGSSKGASPGQSAKLVTPKPYPNLPLQKPVSAAGEDKSSHIPLADQPLPSIEDPAHDNDVLSKIPNANTMTTFSWEFFYSTFGGNQWSPGLYYIPPSHGRSLLPSRTYYALENTYEPYLPTHPGAHGAKLTAFFNTNVEEVDGAEAGAAYEDVPVFISGSNWAGDAHKNQEYVYFGTNSQLRWSDKLDYDRMVEHVPQSVKMYWAEQLSEVGRPEWVTEALMKHFWPKPEYEGAMPHEVANGSVQQSDAAEHQKVLEDLETHVDELKAWERETRVKVGLLKKENILEAFETADAGDPPGLRLWWEYLQCVGWDEKFYNMLVKLQKSKGHGGW